MWVEEICLDFIRIPVFEIMMSEHGRTIVRPIWESEKDRYIVSNYSAAIAINERLNEGQKFLALAHELGHYILHYPFLTFTTQLFVVIQKNPQLESVISKKLTSEWWKSYYTTIELHADIFASLFAIPHQTDKALEAIISSTISTADVPLTADVYRLQWLRNLFETEQFMKWSQTEQLSTNATIERVEAIAQNYQTANTLFERMRWCLYNRDNLLSVVVEEEMNIEASLTEVVRDLHNTSQQESAILIPNSEKLIRRSTIQELDVEFSSVKEYWEPIIIEPTTKMVKGYLGLEPDVYTKKNSAKADWVLYSTRTKSPFGTLKEWLQHAENQKKGLIVFPLSPLDIYLRRNIK